MSKVELLTAKRAAYAQHHYPLTDVVCDALEAIATGRAVVIPVWTEAQAREAYAAQFLPPEVPNAIQQWHLAGWLACARHLGAVR